MGVVPTPPRILALNVHAAWACRHSGACCTAGWAIPVEPERRLRLGRDLLLPGADGTCEFHDREARRCRVHRDFGDDALPRACHHFPRRARLDDDAVTVSLSHFCPTAAADLVRAAEPVAIVEEPAAFPPGRDYEGMDARGAWPPLVKANLLFDVESHRAWERFIVAVLAEDASSPARTALRRVALAAEDLRAWTPSDGPLLDRIAALGLKDDRHDAADRAWTRYAAFAGAEAYGQILACVPAELADAGRPDGLIVAGWPDAGADAGDARPCVSAVARRYVAAKAFGSWAAYETRGLRTMVAELVAADLVFRVAAAEALAALLGASGRSTPADGAVGGSPDVERALTRAVRAADWLFVHLVDRASLVGWLGRAEL